MRTSLLEGPPGTGKSTLLRAVSTARSAPFHLVEGNAELTPARLVGHFDPAQVLAQGYSPDVFVDGPLVLAMRAGGLLYVEEINRVPEETLNVLITVMSEAELTVPRLGLVHAEAGFRLVAAMNPFDAVGTERISSAIYDRTCRISMDYQSAATEAEIVALRAPAAGVTDDWRAQVVELVRRTRSHPDVRIGSSVRGAIDIVAIAGRLLVDARGAARRLARRPGRGAGRRCRDGSGCTSPPAAARGGRRASSTRRSSARRRPTTGARRGPTRGSLSPPPPQQAGRPQQRSNPKQDAARNRTVGRSTLARHARFAEVSPEVGVLDEQALDRALASDPDGTLALVADLVHATDESLRARARRLAARLVIDRSRSGRPVRSGTARPAARAGQPGRRPRRRRVPGRDPHRARRARARPTSTSWPPATGAARTCAVCLLVDASGSMSGERLAVAATVAAACALRAPAQHAVIAFAGDVRTLRHLHGQDPAADRRRPGARAARARRDPAGRRPARGLAPSWPAARAQRRVVVLLSDCRHTDEDPLPVARTVPELVVLAPRDDAEQAHAFAAAAGARCAELAGADSPRPPPRPCNAGSWTLHLL